MQSNRINLLILDNDFEGLKTEIQTNPQSIHSLTPGLLNTPLHIAAREGKYKALQILLENKANIYARNKESWSVLDVLLFKLLSNKESDVKLHQQLIICLELLLKYERKLLSRQEPGLLDAKGKYWYFSPRETLEQQKNHSNYQAISQLFKKYSILESSSPNIQRSPIGLRHRHTNTMTANPAIESDVTTLLGQKALSFLPFLSKYLSGNAENEKQDVTAPFLN